MEKIETLDFEEKPKKKSKLKIVLIIILLFIIIAAVALYLSFRYLTSSKTDTSSVINFTVEEGSSVYAVGQKLEKEGIIRSALMYKVIVKIKKIEGFKAGVYRLDKSLDLFDIIDLLTGENYDKTGFSITFKEGKKISNIIKTINQTANIPENDVYTLLEDDSYIDSLIDKYWFLTDDIKNEEIYYPLEGYLYPETYSFGKKTDAKQIIEEMLNQTDKVLSKYKTQIEASSYSIHELVTLASVVEQEGIYKDDRKMIAGVFYNRLKNNMPLGSDVTTYYAFKVDLSERDLTKAEIDTYNPYNTRGPQMNGKLPVGPISNFSETSFEAVLNPTESDYYYFVADKSGKTHFSKTYSEHTQIVNELKKAGNWIEW